MNFFNAFPHIISAISTCVCECSVMSSMSNFSWPHRLQPARFLSPWNSPERMLEWVAIPFLRGSSQPRDRTHVSCIIGGLFTQYWAPARPPPKKPFYNQKTVQFAIIYMLLFSHSVVSDFLWPRGQLSARLLSPRDFPSKNTGAGSHMHIYVVNMCTQYVYPSYIKKINIIYF